MPIPFGENEATFTFPLNVSRFAVNANDEGCIDVSSARVGDRLSVHLRVLGSCEFLPHFRNCDSRVRRSCHALPRLADVGWT